MIHTLILAFFLGASPAFALAPVQNGGALLDDPEAWAGADLSARWGDVRATANPDGGRSPENRKESVRNFTARGAVAFDENVQAGLEVQLADRERTGDDHSTNLSELNADLGFRYGAALTYAQVTTPVSRSAYEMENQYQLDALGRGFWAIGLGQLWTVALGRTTLFATYELHRSFPRAFANQTNAGKLVPGFGANWAVGVSEKIERVSLGLSLAQAYEDPVAVEGDRESRGGSAQRFFTPTLSLGVDLGAQWTLAATWADQTIFPAATASLMREAGLSVNTTW